MQKYKNVVRIITKNCLFEKIILVGITLTSFQYIHIYVNIIIFIFLILVLFLYIFIFNDLRKIFSFKEFQNNSK